MAIADLRAALAAKTKTFEQPVQKARTDDLASYPFWNTPVGAHSTIRFLPDADTTNSLFWVPKFTTTLTFDGIVGGEFETSDEVGVKLTTMKTWDKKCPITEGIRKYWKGSEAEQAIARKYYPKAAYLYQGFVVHDGVNEAETPENPIRRFMISPQIHKIIEAALMDDQIEDMPTDYDNGLDFRITATKQGTFNNYGSSAFARKPRSLNATERAAIDTYGLFNLKQFVGNEPTTEQVEMMAAMFADSLAGKPFDYNSYGSVYRAYRTNSNSYSGPTASVVQPSVSTQTKAEELMARVRNKVSA